MEKEECLPILSKIRMTPEGGRAISFRDHPGFKVTILEDDPELTRSHRAAEEASRWERGYIKIIWPEDLDVKKPLREAPYHYEPPEVE